MRVGNGNNKGIGYIELSVTVADVEEIKDNMYEISFFTNSSKSDYWWRMYDLSLDSVVIDSQPTLKTNDSVAKLLLINPI